MALPTNSRHLLNYHFIQHISTSHILAIKIQILEKGAGRTDFLACFEIKINSLLKQMSCRHLNCS